MSAIVIPNGNRLQRGLSGDLWGKYPWHRAMFDPTYGTLDGDNFSPFLAENYTARQLSGASGTATSQAALHGELRLSAASTTDHDGYQLQRGDGTGAYYAPQTDGTILMEGLFELGTGLVTPAFFFGLCTVATDAQEDGLLQGTNMVGFYAVGDGLSIDFISKNNSSSDVAAGNSATSFVAAEWIKLGLKIHNRSIVTPYVNGVALTSKVITDSDDIPDPTDYMVPTMSIANGGASSSETCILDINWWQIWQSDKADIVGT